MHLSRTCTILLRVRAAIEGLTGRRYASDFSPPRAASYRRTICAPFERARFTVRASASARGRSTTGRRAFEKTLPRRSPTPIVIVRPPVRPKRTSFVVRFSLRHHFPRDGVHRGPRFRFGPEFAAPSSLVHRWLLRGLVARRALGVLIGPVFCFGRQKNAVRIFVESTDDDDGRPTGARGN